MKKETKSEIIFLVIFLTISLLVFLRYKTYFLFELYLVLFTLISYYAFYSMIQLDYYCVGKGYFKHMTLSFKSLRRGKMNIWKEMVKPSVKGDKKYDKLLMKVRIFFILWLLLALVWLYLGYRHTEILDTLWRT